jgi:hypothetical protein
VSASNLAVCRSVFRSELSILSHANLMREAHGDPIFHRKAEKKETIGIVAFSGK